MSTKTKETEILEKNGSEYVATYSESAIGGVPNVHCLRNIENGNGEVMSVEESPFTPLEIIDELLD